jgi:hypothetical protein
VTNEITRGVWRGGTVGLLVAAVLTALFVVFFPLSAVGSMASLAFLIVYGTVSAGHLRVYRYTGAKPWLLVLAVVLNAALFVLLLGYTIHTGPASTWITLLAVLALSFVFEIVYRKRTGRTLKTEPQRIPSRCGGRDAWTARMRSITDSISYVRREPAPCAGRAPATSTP